MTSPDNNTLPRKGSQLYNFIHHKGEQKKKTLSRYKALNKYLVIPLYRIYLLPLLGFGRIFLLLQTVGRRTGRKRITSLEYHRWKGRISIVAGRGRKADWYRNMKANPDSVRVQVGFSKFKPEIHFLESQEEKLEMMKWYVQKHSRSAQFLFGWDPQRDNPETTDLTYLVSVVEIVRLKN